MIMHFLKRLRCPAFGTASASDVKFYVAGWLRSAGWRVDEDNQFAFLNCLLARRQSIVLVVHCSGLGNELLGVIVKDVNQATAHLGFHPLFVIGTKLDPRAAAEMQSGHDICLAVHDLFKLDDEIDRLRPEVTGCVDYIAHGRILSGWAKLSPRGRARILAVSNVDVIGEAVADEFREDLRHLGDGNYGFRLVLSEPRTRDEILDNVRVKVYSDDVFIARLKYWDHVVVK